jgi:hypothetical protein
MVLLAEFRVISWIVLESTDQGAITPKALVEKAKISTNSHETKHEEDFQFAPFRVISWIVLPPLTRGRNSFSAAY